jgi:hypothetical protein
MAATLKVAIVVLADTETHEGMGRVANALEAVKELKQHGDDVRLIFDGGGVTWAVALSSPEHKMHGLYQEVADRVSGICSFCAGAFGVKDAAIECKLKLLDEYDGHPSFRELLAQGYQIVTF